MKTIITIVAVLAFSSTAIAMAVASPKASKSGVFSILTNDDIVEQGDIAPAVPPASVPGEIIIDEPYPAMSPVIVGHSSAAFPVGHGCCTTCCKKRCRCRRATTPTIYCLEDLCGCSHEACIDVPVCCAGEQPCITWRHGILDRQIATLCWECCDYQAKVIITCKGKVRVRD